MGTINTDYTNIDYKALDYKNLKLSVILTADSFFYALHDTVTQQMISYKREKFDSLDSYPEPTIASYFLDNGVDIVNIKKIKVSISNSSFALVPEALYDKNQKPVYLRNLTDIHNSKALNSDYLEKFKMYNVYEMSSNDENLTAGIKNQKTTHFVSELINSMAGNTNQVLLNLNEDVLIIVAMVDKIIHLANYYQVESKDEILYYTMLVFDQLQLDPNEFEVAVSGKFDTDSNIFMLLNEFIRSVKPVEIKDGEIGSIELLKYPSHVFYDIHHVSK